MPARRVGRLDQRHNLFAGLGLAAHSRAARFARRVIGGHINIRNVI